MQPLIIPAKWFTPVSSRLITLAVVHRQEAPVEVGTAEGTARFFQNLPANRKASAHRIYDPGTVVQAVEYHDVAYHCPGLNSRGAGFELPGYSKDNDWASPPMESSMSLCASDIVDLASAHPIPLTWLNYQDLLKGARSGITSHVEATKAGIMGNNHTDPGVYFPVGRFMEIVQSQGGSHLPPPVAAGKFNGGQYGLDPNSGVGSVTVQECKLPGTGFYTLTADGGIRAGNGANFPPPPAIASYPGLPPTEREGDRYFVGITPNEDGSSGYTLWSNDRGRFAFGPGKNNWPG